MFSQHFRCLECHWLLSWPMGAFQLAFVWTRCGGEADRDLGWFQVPDVICWWGGLVFYSLRLRVRICCSSFWSPLRKHPRLSVVFLSSHACSSSSRIPPRGFSVVSLPVPCPALQMGVRCWSASLRRAGLPLGTVPQWFCSLWPRVLWLEADTSGDSVFSLSPLWLCMFFF